MFVVESIFSAGKLKNRSNHGANGTYDLCNARPAYPVYTVIEIWSALAPSLFNVKK